MDVRRCLLLAVAGALSWSLTGCSDGEPKAEPVPSSPTDATSSPTEVVSPTVPADETAEEFIRRWFKVSAEFQNSGDSAAFLAISQGCAECQKTVELIEGYYRAGGEVTYGGEEITGVKRHSAIAENYFEFHVGFDPEPTTYRESSGSPQRRIEGEPLNFTLYVERTATGWQVRKYLQRDV